MEQPDITNQMHMNMQNDAAGAATGKRFSRGVIIGIMGLIILIHFGFYHSYIKHFPSFKPYTEPAFGIVNFNWIMHFHGMMMMGWILMLLVQPILIRKGRKDLHRRIGKLSYILAPLVVLSIYLANKDAYHKTVQVAGEHMATAFLSLTFPAVIFFSVLYILAMYFKDKPALHMRFMISTAFLFIPPALDRALAYFFDLPGYDVGNYIQLSIIAAVVIIDSVKTKKISPFTLVFAFELLHKMGWHARETEAWQVIGRTIAKIL